MECTPKCGAKAMAQLEGFHCIICGRYVEHYETALFSGMRMCSECYYEREAGRRCARCFRKLESWEGRVFSDGNEYCDLLPACQRALREEGHGRLGRAIRL